MVDSARDHIYEIKALKNFHYIDEKGKDQGINGNFDFILLDIETQMDSIEKLDHSILTKIFVLNLFSFFF